MAKVDSNSVAIIGGGCAGLTVATYLAQAGIPVCLYEAAPQLGGRTRRVIVNDYHLDNGQHIMLGAYQHLFDLLSIVRDNDAIQQAFDRLPLRLELQSIHRQAHFELKCPSFLPAPLHLLFGLLNAKGISLQDKWLAASMITRLKLINYQLDKDFYLSNLLDKYQQSEVLIRYLWEPLCLAALNTPIAEASAQIFLNVLHDSFEGSRKDSDLLLPREDLSTLLIDPIYQYLADKNVRVHVNQRIRYIDYEAGIFKLHAQQTHETNDHPFNHSHVVIAIGPHQRKQLNYSPALINLAQQNTHQDFQSISTLYLQYPTHTSLGKPMLGLTESVSQWVFDRGYLYGQHGLMAVVVSAAGAHQHLNNEDLLNQVLQELEHIGLPRKECSWHQVITEKRATFSCTPQRAQISMVGPQEHLYFVGDDVSVPGLRDYPATIESAIRSGQACANMIINQ